MMIPGLNNATEPMEKHEYGIWMFRDSNVYAECLSCREMAFCEPSNYCPHCGAAMLNVVDARREYKKGVGQNE